MNEIEDAVNGVEKAGNGVTALGTIIMHIVRSQVEWFEDDCPMEITGRMKMIA